MGLFISFGKILDQDCSFVSRQFGTFLDHALNGALPLFCGPFFIFKLTKAVTNGAASLQ